MTDPWSRPGEPEPQQDKPAPQAPGYTNPSFAPLGYPEPSGTPAQQTPPGYEQPPYTPYGQPAAQAGQLAPAQAYGYQPGYPQQQPEHPYSVAALVLGIVGFFTGITFPVAWILGAVGTAQMRREPGRWRPSPMLTAGKWIGIVGTLLGLLAILGMMLIFVLAVSTSSAELPR